VASRVGGIPDLIGKENGILVPPEQPTALAAALCELRGDSARRSQMGRTNVLKARGYAWQVVGEQFVHLYQELAS
jgi:glycosyltransferase involved in cell wall biosynthesis